MPLHLIGLGLHDASDVTLKGQQHAKACAKVYAEFYTAVLTGADHGAIEAALGCSVEVLPREGVETGGKDLVEQAREADIALLTAGDPLTATTHADLVLRCRREGVPVHIVHAPSIYSAAPGLLGLQHYKFGRTTTLVRPEDGWSPTSPFDAVAENHAAGLHTLVLLDIKTHEEPSYFMTAPEGIAQLLDLAKRTGNDWFDGDAQVGIVARAGSDVPFIATGPARRLQDVDAGGPLHCLVIPGDMQVVEQESWDSLAHDG